MKQREASKPEPRLHTTRDGSHTLFSKQFDQYYHNPNGAVAESKHVFFRSTDIKEQLARHKDLTILEIGFGTGLNLLLLFDLHQKLNSNSRVIFQSIEAFPISSEIARTFNFGEYMDHPEQAHSLPEIFDVLKPGQNKFSFSDHIQLRVFYGFFKDFEVTDLNADYIFHDAFSPGVNPDLWTGNMFQKLKTHSHPEGMLTTYCAASKARGAMSWAGWHVARAQGALGKREMTVASLLPKKLSHLKRVNEERLSKRYETGDFD